MVLAKSVKFEVENLTKQEIPKFSLLFDNIRISSFLNLLNFLSFFISHQGRSMVCLAISIPLLLSSFFPELLSFPEKAACAPANGMMQIFEELQSQKLIRYLFLMNHPSRVEAECPQ